MCCHIRFNVSSVCRDTVVLVAADGSKGCLSPSGGAVEGALVMDTLQGLVLSLSSMALLSISPPLSTLRRPGRISLFPPKPDPTPLSRHAGKTSGPSWMASQRQKGVTTLSHPVFSPHLIQHQTLMDTVSSQALILWAYQKEWSHKILSLWGPLALVSWFMQFGQNMQHRDGRQNTCESCSCSQEAPHGWARKWLMDYQFHGAKPQSHESIMPHRLWHSPL